MSEELNLLDIKTALTITARGFQYRRYVGAGAYRTAKDDLAAAIEEIERLRAALGSRGIPQEEPRQELINDLYRLFTMTTQEIAAAFGESRCKDDSGRINYALELLSDFITESPVAEPFFKPNADFKQVKDWVQDVPAGPPHQEEKA